MNNLKNFSKSNNINLDLIIIFNKTTNLFTLKINTFRIVYLNTSYYIIFNYILNYLNELFIYF